MTIQVTGKNLDVGEALRSYVQGRVGQTVEKFIGRDTTGHVRIEKEHGEFRTNCSIHLWQGMSLEARGEAPDPYQSADLACERLEKRVRRYKRRLKRKGGGETPRRQTPATDYVIQAAQAEHKERDEDNPVIIAEAESPVHEMSVGDAVMQMDLSDRPFVMFRNASHGEINMVYRRDDGNIGWIDPAVSLRSSLAPSAAKKRSGVTARNKSSAQSKAKKARKRG
ncbi:MAG TPA: ribosome-associated translation inhibitor RaiA [Vitreimonas sp.]|nr:ribosome-associated translation inhibitor RaiA [Vitreimonas sp.]